MKKTKKALASLAIASMALTAVPFNVFAAGTVPTRIAGVTAEQTAVAIADQTGYTGAAILASSTSYGMVDALTAGPLAASLKAPILLTGAGNSLDAATKAELTKLAVKTVYVASGTAVIKQGVLDELVGMGIAVMPLGGNDASATSVNIAKKMTGVTKVAVANSIPDALSIAAVAAAANEPILLTNKDALPSGVADYIASAGITAADVIGGTGVISDAVKAALPSATRHAGLTAYDTNNQVIQDFASALKFDNVYVANGQTGIDALAGAPLAAQTNSAIVLTDGTVPAAATFVKSKLASGSVVTALGGAAVVPDSVREGVANGSVVAPSALTVTSVSAVNTNSTDVLGTSAEGGTKFKVVFSKPINKDSVSSTNFVLKQGNNVVATTRDQSSDKTSVTVTPAAALEIGKEYTFSVTAGILADADTSTLASGYSSTFTIADTLSLVSITDQAANVIEDGAVLDTAIYLTFNKDLDESTITTGNIKLYNVNDGKYVPVTFTSLAVSGSKVIRVTPAVASYDNDKTYTLTVNGVAALDGKKVTGYSKTYGHVASAPTFAITALTAPTGVTGIYPGLSATQIRYTAGGVPAAPSSATAFKGQVTFSRAMNEASLNQGNLYFAKVDVSGTEIAGTRVDSVIAYDENSLIATVTPKAELAQDTDYKLFVSKEIKDAFGAAVVANSLAFSTADLTAPTVKSTSVDNGDSVKIKDDIVIHFSEKMEAAQAVLVAKGAGEQAFTAGTSVRVMDVTGNQTLDATTAGYAGLALNTGFMNDKTDPRLIITHPTAGWVAERNYRIDLNGFTVGETTMSLSDDITGTKIHGNMLLGDYTKSFSTAAVEAAKVLKVYATADAAGASATTAGLELNKSTDTTNVQDHATAAGNMKFKIVFDKKMVVGAGLQFWLDDGAGGGVADDGVYQAGEKINVPAGELALDTTNITNDTLVWTPTANIAQFQGGNDEFVGQIRITNALVDADGKAFGTSSSDDIGYRFILGTGPEYNAATSTPYKFQAGIGTGATLTVGFLANADFTTINSTNIVVTKKSDGSVVAGTWYNFGTTDTVNVNAAKFDFEPTADLESNTDYLITVGAGVLDAAGNATAPYAVPFKTADSATPVATVTMPDALNATDPIVVTYNTAMNTASNDATDPDQAAAYVLTVNGAPVPFSVVYDADTKTAKIWADTVFPADAVINFAVQPGIKGTNGKSTASIVKAGGVVGAAADLVTEVYNVKSATYNVALKQLVVTLTRKADAATVTAAGGTGIVLTGSNYVAANNFVGVGVSTDGLTLTYALKDDVSGAILNPLSIVPGVTKISLAASVTYTDSTGPLQTYDATARKITAAQ